MSLVDTFVDTADDYPKSRHQNTACILCSSFCFCGWCPDLSSCWGLRGRPLPQARFSSEAAACECRNGFSLCCTVGGIVGTILAWGGGGEEENDCGVSATQRVISLIPETEATRKLSLWLFSFPYCQIVPDCISLSVLCLFVGRLSLQIHNHLVSAHPLIYPLVYPLNDQMILYPSILSAIHF